MQQTLIFWPLLAQLAMSLLLYIPLVRLKSAAVKNRQVDLRKTALDQNAWPEAVQKVNNNIRNQFETPILFYVLCIVLFVTGQVTMLVLSLAWLYVLSRVAHMWVHTRSNYVPWRMRLFALGMVILLVLLILTGIGLM